jgi:hypothetical protein
MVIISNPSKFVGPTLDASSDLIKNLNDIRDARNRLSSAQNPKTTDPEKKVWADKQKTAVDSADAILKAVGDPTGSFVKDFLAAESIGSIPLTTCTLNVSAHASASSLITKTSILSSDKAYETGTSVLTYDVEDTSGRYLAAGIYYSACEIGSPYKLGEGTPPDLKSVKCSTSQ